MGFSPYSPGVRSDRSAGDRSRHRAKVKQAMRENLREIISEETIIGQDPHKKFSVPVRAVKEYQFVYGDNPNTRGVATGDGSVNKGDTLKSRIEQGEGSEQGHAGSNPGELWIEVEIDLTELADLLFDDIRLPDLVRKQLRDLESDRTLKRKAYRRQGIRVRLDMQRTMRERMKRKLATGWTAASSSYRPVAVSAPFEWQESAWNGAEGAQGGPKDRFPFRENDFRYRHVVEHRKPQSNAVVFFMMDVSASMGTQEKYLARSLFFLIYQFVRVRYEKTEVVFLAHHTQAEEVDEYTFFHRGESGGTVCSTVFGKALEVIGERYSPEAWNIYAFYCSDGDNLSSDAEVVATRLRELLVVANRVGYVETRGGANSRETALDRAFMMVNNPHFVRRKMAGTDDVWPTFQALFDAHMEGSRQGITARPS